MIRRKQERHNPQDLSKPKAYLFSDAYSLAGFVFEEKEGAVCPVHSFQLDAGDITTTLNELLGGARAQYGIERVAVPPIFDQKGNRERLNNQLYQAIKQPFIGEIVQWSPEPIQALLLRTEAISKGRLNELAYPGAEKLREKLRQLSADRPAAADVMAYLNGVYDLLKATPEPARRHYPTSRWNSNNHPGVRGYTMLR